MSDPGYPHAWFERQVALIDRECGTLNTQRAGEMNGQVLSRPGAPFGEVLPG